MENFTKIVNPSKVLIGTRRYNSFAEIVFKDGKLTIHGVVAPLKSGNCIGSCGQCYDEICDGTPTSEWNNTKLQTFRQIWKTYHLNDLHAECEHQRNLHIDASLEHNNVCPICGYHYGTEWKFMEVPTDILQWLKDLPNTKINPNWV